MKEIVYLSCKFESGSIFSSGYKVAMTKTTFMSKIERWLDKQLKFLNFIHDRMVYILLLYDEKGLVLFQDNTSKKKGIAISAENKYIPGIMKKKIHFLANKFASFSLIMDNARMTAITPWASHPL